MSDQGLLSATLTVMPLSGTPAEVLQKSFPDLDIDQVKQAIADTICEVVQDGPAQIGVVIYRNGVPVARFNPSGWSEEIH